MGHKEIVVLIYGILAFFLLGQIIASGNLGNRSYSIWYETHFLIKKQGICKLIYYKAKHFGRYTLFEVIGFFISFLFSIILGCLAILLSFNILSVFIFKAFILLSVGLLFISNLVVIIINDIGSHKDVKKKFYLESGEREINIIDYENLSINNKHDKLIKKVLCLGVQTRNNPYFTIYNLRDSYHQRIKNARKDIEKIEKINLEYIEYFKNIDKLIVIKENKDGTLVFKKGIDEE